MSGLHPRLVAWLVIVSSCVTALSIGAYDLLVRQPRTPRLAVVDIARLFAAAETRAKESVLALAPRLEGSTSAPGVARAAELAGLQATEAFGPTLEKTLTDLSSECRCAIVAMAAVIGSSATVPDYTRVAAERLGISLRPAAAR